MSGLTNAREVEKCGGRTYAGCLLHVVRNDHDGEALFELLNQVLDGQRRNGVESRAGLVHEQNLRLNGDGTCDAQSLLLSTRQPRPRSVQAILDLFPQVGAAQRLFDNLVHRLLIARYILASFELQSGNDVVVDRHRGERVRSLKHHANGAPHVDGIDFGVVDVLSVKHDLAVNVGTGDDFVHAVERAQHRRLAASGRSDERCHGTGLNAERDALDREELAVVDVEVTDIDALGHGVAFV